jgi:isocitrate/isopropylmalate dehydrogenase
MREPMWWDILAEKTIDLEKEYETLIEKFKKNLKAEGCTDVLIERALNYALGRAYSSIREINLDDKKNVINKLRKIFPKCLNDATKWARSIKFLTEGYEPKER